MTKTSVEDISVAILHDRFPQIGGGEKFAIEAARVLNAPIYTMYISSGVDTPDDVEIIPIAQRKYASGISKHLLEWKNEGMNPFETLNVALDMTDAHPALSEFEVILESAPLSKHYVPTPDQTILHYPHSPPRWLYDLYRDRVAQFTYPLVEFFVKAYAKIWRTMDKEANDYVDQFVANSELIRDRIQRFYDVDAEVVYPPVTGDWRNDGDEGYFVTWSRLAPEKRIPLLAEAFTELDEKLIIAGDGKERKKIERISRDYSNIEVRGFVDDIESLVASATAVIYTPKQEDFGLVGAEALCAGKPLLGVNEGFTKYQVQEGETGILFEPNAESIRDTVRRFDACDFDSETIQQTGQKYTFDSFRGELQVVVEKSYQESK